MTHVVAKAMCVSTGVTLEPHWCSETPSRLEPQVFPRGVAEAVVQVPGSHMKVIILQNLSLLPRFVFIASCSPLIRRYATHTMLVTFDSDSPAETTRFGSFTSSHEKSTGIKWSLLLLYNDQTLTLPNNTQCVCVDVAVLSAKVTVWRKTEEMFIFKEE